MAAPQTNAQKHLDGMRRALAVMAVMAALLASGVTTADAKGKPVTPLASTYTITVQYDADVPSSWSRRAPLVWESGTRLNLVRGTCEGALCIHVHTDALGSLCSPGNGCASEVDLHTTRCDVWLPNGIAASQSRGTQWSMFVHEVGHCLGLPHSDGTSWTPFDNQSIMWPQVSICCPIVSPDAQDIANVNTLWL